MGKRLRQCILLTASLGFVEVHAGGHMAAPEEPGEVGMRMIGDTYFAAPDGTVAVKVLNGTFEEAAGDAARGWGGRGLVVRRDQAPERTAYVHCNGGSGNVLNTSGLAFADGLPHFLSCWLRSPAPISLLVTVTKADAVFGRHAPLSLPATGGEWKRVGAYFRNVPGGEGGTLVVRGTKDHPVPAFDIDDVRLRTATEAEFSRAWASWRKDYPERDVSPRQTDGANLALTLRKLGHGLDPDRPFLIWAIGSSYTNMLGDGEILRQHILKRFPNAPRIVYKKHVGSAVPWQYIRGWANHIVVPEQPDLVLIYTIGKPENLDCLLTDLRHSTTADIIVPSIHWRIRDKDNWDKSEDAIDQKVADVRAVCAKHGVEFVENRREWAEYMRAHNMKVEIDAENGLLKDAVHQSDYGALVINESIARHIAGSAQSGYRPQERERRLEAVAPVSTRAGESVVLDGDWRIAGRVTRSDAKGATVTVRFRGNRLDMVGTALPDGGSASITIDGIPAGDVPAFYATYIECGPKNTRPERGLVADRSPHGVGLGRNIVAQTWTIEMIDDNGNYRLTGSETGPDGEGNCLQSFTSKSGQISVAPELWRCAQDSKTGTFSNRTGDVFTFAVRRCTLDVLSLRADSPVRSAHRLAWNLPNGEHTLTLVCNGDGPVTIGCFDVYEPPLGAEPRGTP